MRPTWWSPGWLVGGQNWGWLGKIQELENDSSVYIYICVNILKMYLRYDLKVFVYIRVYKYLSIQHIKVAPQGPTCGEGSIT